MDAFTEKLSDIIYRGAEELEDIYRRWGDRVGIIGGVDVNLLSEGTEAAIRKRTR